MIRMWNLSHSVVFLLALLALPAASYTIGDQHFPDRLTASDDHPQLELNGASIRSYYYLIDTYVGLLYLENPSTEADDILNDAGYKRIIYHILVNRVSGRRIAKAMYEALQLNVSREEARRLEDRLNQLVKMFDAKMQRGDEGYVDYVPGLGSRVVINGEVKGIIPGKDLYDALLRIWIGEHPVSRRFKQEILNRSPAQVADN